LKKILTIVAFLLVWTGQAAAWEVAKQKKGITIETEKVAGSELKKWKAHMNVDASLSTLVAIMDDTEGAPKWMFKNKAVKLDKKISFWERWVYVWNGAPFPLSDRDTSVHSMMSQDADTLNVTVALTSDPARRAEVKGRTRITAMDGSWKFNPAEDGTVDVYYEMFLDPGGKVPAKLVSKFVTQAPYETMIGLRKLLESGAHTRHS